MKRRTQRGTTRQRAARAFIVLGFLVGIAPPLPGQSLWSAPGSTEASLFADHVARRIGDVITVMVREKMSVQDDGKLELTRESELDSALRSFDVAPSAFDPLPSFGYSSQRTVDGESKFSQKGKIESVISVVVVDVKPNGVLMIEGSRTLFIDGDYKRMVIVGLVRPIDIGADNTVSSDRVVNAEVRYENEGPRSLATRKNWFENLLDWIWPF